MAAARGAASASATQLHQPEHQLSASSSSSAQREDADQVFLLNVRRLNKGFAQWVMRCVLEHPDSNWCAGVSDYVSQYNALANINETAAPTSKSYVNNIVRNSSKLQSQVEADIARAALVTPVHRRTRGEGERRNDSRASSTTTSPATTSSSAPTSPTDPVTEGNTAGSTSGSVPSSNDSTPAREEGNPFGFVTSNVGAPEFQFGAFSPPKASESPFKFGLAPSADITEDVGAAIAQLQVSQQGQSNVDDDNAANNGSEDEQEEDEEEEQELEEVEEQEWEEDENYQANRAYGYGKEESWDNEADYDAPYGQESYNEGQPEEEDGNMFDALAAAASRMPAAAVESDPDESEYEPEPEPEPAPVVRAVPEGRKIVAVRRRGKGKGKSAASTAAATPNPAPLDNFLAAPEIDDASSTKPSSDADDGSDGDEPVAPVSTSHGSAQVPLFDTTNMDPDMPLFGDIYAAPTLWTPPKMKQQSARADSDDE